MLTSFGFHEYKALTDAVWLFVCIESEAHEQDKSSGSNEQKKDDANGVRATQLSQGSL